MYETHLVLQFKYLNNRDIIYDIYNMNNIDTFETQFMEEKWQKDFKKLEKEADDFRDYFDKNRKCRCNIYSCRHFKKANSELFDEKFHELVNRKMHIGLRTMMECAPELFEKKS